MTTHPTSNCSFSQDVVYDVALSSLGFERRSTFLARSGLSARTNVAFAFESHRVQAFDQNLSDVKNLGLTIFDRPEPEFGRLVKDVLTGQASRVAVDISSMTRRRLATVVQELQARGELGPGLTVDFFYCPAKYSPVVADDIEVLEAGPLPGYEGPLRRASLPVGAVLGLGYEPHRALGVLEYLEPSTAWIFAPLSSPDYESAVAGANDEILASVPPQYRLDYELADPAGTVNALESLSFSAGETRRIVIVPMGPKIFALAALLVGLVGRDKRPAVWRVGEGNLRQPQLAEENGRIVGLKVQFGST